MTRSKKEVYYFILTLLLVLTQDTIASTNKEQRIKKITVKNSTLLPETTIKNKIPYHEGELFLPIKTNEAITNIYNLGYFSQIIIKTKELADQTIELIIELTEKPIIESITFKGNKHLPEKEIDKKIHHKSLKAAEKNEVENFTSTLKKLYEEKGYLNPSIDLKTTTNKNKTTATFSIKEGVKSVVKKVEFNGNKHFHDKKLRSLLFTKEDWLLSPLDKAGTYHPLAIEQDKINLENFYQSNGYLHAKVTEVKTTFSKDKKSIVVVFVIDEGDFYTFGNVKVIGNEIYSEKKLTNMIPIKSGDPYSRDAIKDSIEGLKTLWGNKGYIDADVEPALQPNDETKTVDITFYSELKNKIKLNKINIFGNKKSRDKVIRRQFLLDETDLLTTTQLELSKNRIAGLGYFDPKDGVVWKLNRINEDLTDIDVMLKEVKTGRGEFKINYGGSPNSISSSSSGVSGEFQLSERNLFGKGMIANFNTRIGKNERAFSAGFNQPWLFDKPINFGVNGGYAKTSYDELKKVVNEVEERRANGVATLGFIAEKFGHTMFNLQAGIDSFDYYSRSLNDQENVKPEAQISGDNTVKNEYQVILNNRFQSGTFAILECNMGQDTRNHYTHISEGTKWTLSGKIGIPTFNEKFSFYKISFDGHYYTPLINQTDLVLHLHGHFGYVNNFKNKHIPFRELYNIGGQASIRGWTFGQVGPLWYHPNLIEDEGWQGEPIGGKKAAFFNAELTFPLTSDLSIKGVVFYDGGSGWDTPNSKSISKSHLKNNSFDYRHSIGIGLRMLNPQPIRIDWGFKLDKRTGETSSEVSFSSYYDF